MLKGFKKNIEEYPVKFWILAGASFVDTIGKTILFPFFTLYITRRFEVGMTEAGILLAIFSVMGMIGGMVGGALTDRMGRRAMLLAGLILSAFSSLSMGFIGSLPVFYTVAFFVGFFSDIASPARHAMIADLLPEEQRSEGYGVFRVVNNLAWIIGPSIGGFLAAYSYLYLFIADAVMSSLTALIVLKFIPESRPEGDQSESGHSFWRTMSGYRVVFRNRLFMAFLGVVVLMVLVYTQLYSSLSVYMRDFHGFSPSRYGFLMSLNASLVVLLQFWVTRKIRDRNPFLIMALGSLFYLAGYTSFGFIESYTLFMVAAVLITFGEMLAIPVQLGVVARIAPPAMRGRYMAVSDFSFAIPSTIGPWAAGLVLDNYDPNLLWYLSGVVSLLAIAGFLILFFRTRKTPAFQAPPPEDIPEEEAGPSLGPDI